ncbi:hypothetical protein BDA96_08G069800 [Sorghum bicolor]|uniref:Uncharacterized protein n=2 Tax=Sorghum bicolor TaxID=4558 RepID=A0A921U6U6_SORBI|nr:hypothetical protein BDA96_08G069800 [Sorghum bicolor]OQU84676.1 hypothetical protein SORBI_3004G101601 [Sorghum bicolor]
MLTKLEFSYSRIEEMQVTREYIDNIEAPFLLVAEGLEEGIHDFR